MQIAYLSEAEEDLAGIWQYTAETWSLDQADAYIDDIRQAISKASAAPHHLKPWSVIRADICRLKVNHHYVFARVIERELIIVRILHERMDFLQHLDS